MTTTTIELKNMEKFYESPTDIILKILSYDDRFFIKNGLVMKTIISSNDVRYELLTNMFSKIDKRGTSDRQYVDIPINERKFYSIVILTNNIDTKYIVNVVNYHSIIEDKNFEFITLFSLCCGFFVGLNFVLIRVLILSIIFYILYQ